MIGENSMELIFYDKTAEILDISVGTLKEALKPNRNVLTRAGRRGVKGLLIKEQVMLFAGVNPRTGNKKRLSFEALTPEELALWHQYANEFNSAQSTALRATPEIEHLVQETVREELERQELARIREEKRIAANNAQLRAEQEERFLKDHPKLMREPAVA